MLESTSLTFDFGNPDCVSASQRADIFSVGLVMYEILVDREVFSSELSEAALAREPEAKSGQRFLLPSVQNLVN
jgi:hypothetical protein